VLADVHRHVLSSPDSSSQHPRRQPADTVPSRVDAIRGALGRRPSIAVAQNLQDLDEVGRDEVWLKAAARLSAVHGGAD